MMLSSCNFFLSSHGSCNLKLSHATILLPFPPDLLTSLMVVVGFPSYVLLKAIKLYEYDGLKGLFLLWYKNDDILIGTS